MRWWPWGGRRGGRDAQAASERAGLRLDLDEAREALRTARADLARERDQGGDRVEERVRDEVERLAESVGTAMVQVTTLHHLQRTGAAAPSADDALNAAMRLVRGLERYGIEPVGAVGARERHDPDRHDPVGADPVPRDTPVVVRFVGLTHGGRVLRKAGVEPDSGAGVEPGGGAGVEPGGGAGVEPCGGAGVEPDRGTGAPTGPADGG